MIPSVVNMRGEYFDAYLQEGEFPKPTIKCPIYQTADKQEVIPETIQPLVFIVHISQ
jgi:hypothetical protein